MNEMLAVPPAWQWAARSSKVTFIIVFVCTKVVAASGAKAGPGVKVGPVQRGTLRS